MKPEDIKKLPTPETDGWFGPAESVGLQYGATSKRMGSLEQRLAAVTQDLIDFKSAYNVQNGRLLEQADRDSSETLDSIRQIGSMK